MPADFSFIKQTIAKLKETMLTPLDSLGRDGWERVTVVRKADGSLLCFFKQ